MSLEIGLKSSIFKPRSNIDLNFDMNQVFKKMQVIKASFVLDLKIYTLEEPKIVVEQIEQVLGTEMISYEDI